MNCMYRWIAVGGVVLAAYAEAGAQQQLDSVVGRSGIATFGTIMKVERNGVTIHARTGDKLFPVNVIRKVTYAEDPAELRNARESIGREQYDSAMSELAKVTTNGISRAEVLQDIAYYKAYCVGKMALSGGGDKAAAVTALRDFIDDAANKTSYHYYQAVELVGDLAVAMGRNDAAAQYYGLLEVAPWPDYQMRAGVLLARALLADKQPQEALKKFESVLAKQRDDAASRDQKLFAQIGKAKCLAELDRGPEGIALIEKLIADYDPRAQPRTFARAYNALGRCYEMTQQPQDALLAYLHVDLLFFQEPDAHAEALYHLSQLWQTVNRSERARSARNMLRTRYGGTTWANRP